MAQTPPSEPTITVMPATRILSVGGTATISANSTGTSPLSYQWTKDNAVILSATTATLTLSNFQMSAAGVYALMVSNSAGQVTQTGAIVGLENNSLVLNISVTGSGVLAYQWSKDGVAILGATSSLYVISSLRLADAGLYSVLISNSGSSLTRFTNVLVLQAPAASAPTIIAQPASATLTTGATATFTVAATGTAPLSYQWVKNSAAISGATSATYTIASISSADAGSYTCTVSNSAGSATCSAATLTIAAAVVGPVITVQPKNKTASLGFLAQFSVTATPFVGTNYQWYKNGVIIAGATSFLYTINNTTSADAGSYTVIVSDSSGSVTSTAVILTVSGVGGLTPTISVQPADQTVAVGFLTFLGVTASGAQPLNYQWYKNGTLVAAATSMFFTVGSTQPSDSGSYTVVVSNGSGSVTSSAARVRVGSAPTVSIQPLSQAVIAGGSVNLSVIVDGTAPFGYQWAKDGSPIEGATNAIFTLSAVQTIDAASYTVVITNVAGSSTSSAAILAVTIPNPGRLINLSVLTDIATAGDDFTLGYVVGCSSTSGAKPLVIRAAGPSLGALGVPGTLDDPKLELFAGSTKSSENDNWGGSPQLTTALAAVGAFAYTGPASKDAATTASITTRDNSVRVSAAGSGTGAVIAEIYDATPAASFTTATPRLINVSVRKHLGSGLTMGFVVGGATPAKVLVRGIGPTLGAFGVPGTVVDPQLTLFNASSVKIGENNDWAGTAELTAAFANVGAFALPATSKDAALLVTLAPGNYTAQVNGVNGTTGVALVEVYEVP